MDAGSRPGCSLPMQLPAIAPGKAPEGSPDAWTSAPAWKMWKQFWAPGVGLAQTWPL